MIISKSLTLDFFVETYQTLIGKRLQDAVNHMASQEAKIEVMLGIEDDHVVGMVFYSTGRIYYIYVAKEYRGDGYGFKLFRAALSECKKPMVLVPVGNLKAVESFTRWGMTIKNISLYNYFDECKCVRMEFEPKDTLASNFGTATEKDFEEIIKKTPVVWNYQSLTK